MPRIQAITDDFLEPQSLVPIRGEVLDALTIGAPKFESISEALDAHDAGLKEIAQTVGGIMKYGSSDSARLQAARLASELRGVSKGKESSTINFIITDANSVNLQGIFNPQR